MSESDETHDDQVTTPRFLFQLQLDLVGKGKKEEVRRPHAIDRGDERDRDSAAKFRRIGEIFHHMNQPQHRAEDADGGCVSSGRFPDLGRNHALFLMVFYFNFENLVHGFRFGPVDDQLNSFLYEGIFDVFQFPLEGQQPLLSREVCEIQDQLDRPPIVDVMAGKRQRQGADSSDNDRQRVLDTDRSDRPTDYDDKGGQLQDRAHVAALQYLPPNDRTQRDHDPEYCCNIHCTGASFESELSQDVVGDFLLHDRRFRFLKLSE